MDAASAAPVLPAAFSVLSADALGREVVARYDVGEPTECVLLARSFNDSYLVRAADRRFVLRVYRGGWRTDSDVAYEVELLRHLDRAGVAVAAAVPTRTGRFVWHARAPEGLRQAVLFSFADGTPPGDPYPAEAHGRALAAVHAASDSFASPHARVRLDWARLVYEPLAALRTFVAAPRGVVGSVERVAAALRRQLDRLERAGLDVGACHGDLHGFNLHLRPDGSVILFDFDFCGPGWRAYDLGVFRWWQRLQRKPDADWDAFLRGYTSRRPLGEADLTAVPLFVAVRHLWLLGLAAREADHFGNRWSLDDRFFDRRLKSLREWLAAHPDLAPEG